MSWKVEDVECKTNNHALTKNPKLGYELHIDQKDMNCKFAKSNYIFYFQVRESLSPINIPIPIPASDRGGSP